MNSRSLNMALVIAGTIPSLSVAQFDSEAMRGRALRSINRSQEPVILVAPPQASAPAPTVAGSVNALSAGPVAATPSHGHPRSRDRVRQRARRQARHEGGRPSGGGSVNGAGLTDNLRSLVGGVPAKPQPVVFNAASAGVSPEKSRLVLSDEINRGQKRSDNFNKVETLLKEAEGCRNEAHRLIATGRLDEAERQSRLAIEKLAVARSHLAASSAATDARLDAQEDVIDAQSAAGAVNASDASTLFGAVDAVAEKDDEKKSELLSWLESLEPKVKAAFTTVQKEKGANLAMTAVTLYRGEAVPGVFYDVKLSTILGDSTTKVATDNGVASTAVDKDVKVELPTHAGTSRFSLQVGASTQEEPTPGSIGKKNIVGFLGGAYRFGDYFYVNGGVATNSGEIDPYAGIAVSLSNLFHF